MPLPHENCSNCDFCFTPHPDSCANAGVTHRDRANPIWLALRISRRSRPSFLSFNLITGAASSKAVAAIKKGVGGASPPPEPKKKADCHLGPSLRDLARFADARLFHRDKPRQIPP